MVLQNDQLVYLTFVTYVNDDLRFELCVFTYPSTHAMYKRRCEAIFADLVDTMSVIVADGYNSR